MNKLNRILYLILILCIQVQVHGQTPNLPVACAGGQVRYGVPGKLPTSVIEWEVTGGTVIKNYNDSVDIKWDQHAGIKVIKATENTGFTCAATPSYGYVMVSVPGIKFKADTTICQGQVAVLSPESKYTLYHWSTGSVTDTIHVTSAGWYGLNVTDQAGCVAQDSVHITVNITPKVNLGKDTAICENEIITLDAGEGSLYKWSTSAGDIFRTIQIGKGRNEISVEVTNEFGCVGTDTIKILACLSGFKIPNTFTPNGDGDNDTWGIPYLENYPNASVEVFDRWGRLVFSAKQGYPSKGWDGRSNGKDLPMDSYYYIIKRGDGSDPIVGNITIVR
jgi:gliding motility-associated-like protein